MMEQIRAWVSPVAGTDAFHRPALLGNTRRDPERVGEAGKSLPLVPAICR